MHLKVLSRIFFVIAFLISHSGMSQDWPFELWHEGKIVLEDRDTLVGLVKYDQQQDLIQYAHEKSAGNIYSARKVIFFEIFDASTKQYRKFFTLPYTTAGQYKAPLFFELLAEGKMTLLSREYIELRTVSSPYSINGYTRQVLAHRYFFLNEDGSIEEFTGKKNDLLKSMGKKGKEVDKYIRLHRLHITEKDDMSKIIAFYNSLFSDIN